MYFVYVLQNPKGLLYKGQTDNLEKRLAQHNSDDEFHSWTRKRGPWKLVHFETFQSRTEAKMREAFLKTGKGREFLKLLLSEANHSL